MNLPLPGGPMPPNDKKLTDLTVGELRIVIYDAMNIRIENDGWEDFRAVGRWCAENLGKPAVFLFVLFTVICMLLGAGGIVALIMHFM